MESLARRVIARLDIKGPNLIKGIHLEGLRVARRLLDQYEELWRGRIDRMTQLIADTKERDR